jgi:hypothetical protein
MKVIYAPFKLLVILLAASSLFAVFSCSDDDNTDNAKAPVINNFTPASALPGATVIITGENFSATASDNHVAFGGASATVTSATTTQLNATVPVTAATGKITVTVNGKTATSAIDFTVLQTTITDFSPTAGIVGTTVTITGTNFSTTSSDNVVKFNGFAASVTNATSTQLTVTVPAEATTGKISVTINGSTITSANDFTINAPTITSYTPKIAAAGISVLITGTNFSSVAANNIVKFNGTAAVVTAASATELTATVPAGATTGVITVKVGPNTATSGGNFEMCSGLAELVISNVVVTNTSGATSYLVSFKITNVGAADADASKMSMQNYAVQDVAGSGAVAASGFNLTGAPVLAAGESYTTPNFSCNIIGQNTTSRPYLMITLNDDGSVPECSDANNTFIEPFDP